MTNNTIKDQIIALFQDNADNEISAADMRIYIEAIFNSKEEIITKIALETDLPSSNDNIYEGSLVIIYNDGETSGLYLSTTNQPTFGDLIKI